MLKKLTLTAAVLILVIVSGFGLVFSSLSDDDWRRLAIRLTPLFTSYQLKLDGDFSLLLGSSIGLEATELILLGEESSDSIRIENASIKVDPTVLWYGTLLFEQLNLSGVSIDLFEEEYDEDSSSLIILPVVELAIIDNLKIDYHQLDISDPITLKLEQFAMSNQGSEESPVEIQATGFIENEKFDVSGNFGSIADLNNPDTNYAIDLQFEMQSLEFRAKGFLEDPLAGEGLNLESSAKSEHLGSLFSVFHIEFPEGDTFLLETVAHNTLRQPQLRDLELRVTHNNENVLVLSGEVNDLWSLDVFRLAFQASVPPPSSIFRYLSDTSLGIELIESHGTLQRNHDQLRADSFSLTVSSHSNAIINTQGDFEAKIGAGRRDVSELELNLTSKLLDAGAKSGDWYDLLASIQSVTLQFGIAREKDYLTTRDLKLDVRSDTGDQLLISGDIRKLTPGENSAFEGAELEVYYTTDSFKKSLARIGVDAPKLGRVILESDLAGSSEEMLLKDFEFDVLNIHGMHLEIAGSARLGNIMENEFLTSIDMVVRGDHLNPGSLNETFGWSLEGDSDFKLDANLSAADNRIVVGDISLTNLSHGVQFEALGTATIPVLRDSNAEVLIDYTVNTVYEKSRHLTSLLGIADFPELGAVHSETRITGPIDDLHFTLLNFDAGEKEFMHISASGSVEHLNVLDDSVISTINIRSQIKASSTSAVGKVLDLEIADYGQLHADAKLSQIDGDIGIESLDIKVMKDEEPILAAGGSINGLFDADEIKWRGDLKFDLDSLSDSRRPAFGPDLIELEGMMSWIKKTDGWRLNELFLESPDSLNLKVYAHELDLVVPEPYDQILRMSFSLGENSMAGAPKKENDEEHAEEQDNKHNVGTTAIILDSNIMVGAGEISMQGELSGPGSQGTASLTIDRSSDPWAYRSEVNFTQLDIGELLAGRDTLTDSKTSTKTTESEPNLSESQNGVEYVERPDLFSDQPSDWSFLDSLALDVDIDIKKAIFTEDVFIEDFKSSISINNGTVTLDPYEVKFNDGITRAKVSFSAAGQSPAFTAEWESDDMLIGPLLTQLELAPTVRGQITSKVVLSGHGRSPREMISNLDGYIGLVMEEGQIERKFLDLIATDYFNWTISNTLRQQRFSTVNCSIARFNINNGVITSEVFLVETPVLSVRGGGEIDLLNEKVDVTLLPKKKKQFFTSITPVNIKGDLRGPSISAIPRGAASKEIASYTLIPQIYIPVRALGYLYSMIASDSDASQGCLDFQLEDEGASALESN
jgi:hypothetical protein